VQVQPTASQVELEIAAFMGPHIKRARIALFLVGALYVVLGALDWSYLGEVRARIADAKAYGWAVEPEYESAVTFAYILVVTSVGAGMVQMLLALAAGKRTMLAFNIGLALWIAELGLNVFANGPAIFFGWVFWVVTFFLVFGYVAAYKAQQLRAGRR
jgi:hypothetical protein